ncbi:MAG: hypothetical protein NVS4B10_12920 [Myxococcales bacterium]
MGRPIAEALTPSALAVAGLLFCAAFPALADASADARKAIEAQPFLRDAGDSRSLADLFDTYPLRAFSPSRRRTLRA